MGIPKSFLKLHGCQSIKKTDNSGLGKLPSRFGGLSRVSDRLQKSGEKGEARPLSCRSAGELGAIAKAGTSEGAVKGWETRKGGGQGDNSTTGTGQGRLRHGDRVRLDNGVTGTVVGMKDFGTEKNGVIEVRHDENPAWGNMSNVTMGWGSSGISHEDPAIDKQRRLEAKNALRQRLSASDRRAIAKSEASVDVLRALAIQYRALYLYAQQSHHLTSGPTFLQDHEFYGGLYEAYEAAYDALAERLVGLGARQFLEGVQTEAAAKMQEIGSIASFAALLAAEQSICSQIDAAAKMPAMSEGVRDLLVGLANESQARQYKLGQFLSAGVAKAGTSEGASKGWETRRGAGQAAGESAGIPKDNPNFGTNRIARIDRVYTRTYGDTGQTVTYVEWTKGNGEKGRTEGSPDNPHMKSLIDRGEREGKKHETENW